MQKFLSIVGGIFLLLVFVMAGFIGYGAYQGQGLDASSKAYVEANIPPIISTWSKDELLKRSSPKLLKILDENSGENSGENSVQVDQIFQKLSKLGAMRRFGDVKGEAAVSITNQNGKVITAYYSATAKFENGEAHIAIRLIQLSGQWQISRLNINSPIFLQ